MRIHESDVEAVFRRTGALLDGHFVLASGKHSPRYLEKFQVLQWPRETERLCGALAGRARELGARTIAGPTTGGIILAHEVARQLDVRAVYAERDERGSGRVIRRGSALERGERVFVVDDILTTGGSVDETIAAVRATGAAVVGVGVLVDRSAGATFDVPFDALWRVEIAAFDPRECPQCASGIPARKPGTTPAAVGRA